MNVNQSGSSFVELIISMLLMSIMLLGLDAMQVASLRESQAIYYVNTAIQQIHSFNAANKVNTNEWNRINAELLPQGRGMIKDRGVAVFWGNVSDTLCAVNQIGQSGCIKLPMG
jgi:Tfp pilus assembly protein PilV